MLGSNGNGFLEANLGLRPLRQVLKQGAVAGNTQAAQTFGGESTGSCQPQVVLDGDAEVLEHRMLSDGRWNRCGDGEDDLGTVAAKVIATDSLVSGDDVGRGMPAI